MAVVPGATSPGPDHEAALNWAASLLRVLDNMDREQLKSAWTGEDGMRHREQMKKTAPDALIQVAAYVREHLSKIS